MRIFFLTLVLCVLCGCSTFTKPDGSQQTAPSPQKIEAAGEAVAAATSAVPIWGSALGALAIAAAGAIAAHYRGKEAGWTEAVGQPAQPAVPGQAKVQS